MQINTIARHKATGYKYIKDYTLTQDCETIFDLACRGRITHELAEELVYKLLQVDNNTNKEDKYYG